MSSRKKNKRKTAKTAKAEEVPLEELIEKDDDGTITESDCAQIIRLLSCTGKHLGKTGSDFLEAFKRRCMVFVGEALLFYHELLRQFDVNETGAHLSNRIILIYLIYRCRDLEPELKRKQDNKRDKDSLIGHPFIEFFLSLVEHKFTCASYPSHPAEKYLAGLILSKRSSEIAQMLPAEAIAIHERAECIDPATYSDVTTDANSPWGPFRDHLDRFPLFYEKIPCIDTFDAHLLLDYGRRGLCLPKPYFSSEFVINKPSLCPDGEETWLLKMPPPDEMPYVKAAKIAAAQKDFADQIERGLSNMNLMAATAALFKFSNFHEAMAHASTPEVPSSPGSSSSSNSDTEMDVLITKLLSGHLLSSVETRRVINYVKSASAENMNLKQLATMGGSILPKFIHTQSKLASEVIFKSVSICKENIFWFAESMKHVGLSVACLEILLRIYRNIKDVPLDPLLEYVNFILELCEAHPNLEATQSRYLKILCMFNSALINEGIVKVDDIASPLRQFVLKFSSLREATDLYSVLQSQSSQN